MMGSILAKFDFSDIGLVDNPGQFSFRQRMTSSRQVKEFATLLLYLAKTKSPYLHICLEPMLNDSQYSAEDVYNNALIPKMMYYLATEAPIDGDHLPTIRHWTLCRCFEVKDGNLRLQDTGHVSSFLSTALYMTTCATLFQLCCKSVGIFSDPIGDDFDFSVVTTTSTDAIFQVSKLIQSRLSYGSVHVMCQSARDAQDVGLKLSELLGESASVKVVTSDNSPEEQMESAEEWRSGRVHILVTTTLGLVGNENYKCKTVVVFKHLFCASFVAQAIGRLRVEQRGESSQVFQVLTPQCNDPRNEWMKILCNQGDHLVESFKHDGLLQTEQEEQIFRNWFHTKQCQDVFQLQGCIVENFSILMGNIHRNPCSRCVACKSGRVSAPISEFIPEGDLEMGLSRRAEYEAQCSFGGEATHLDVSSPETPSPPAQLTQSPLQATAAQALPTIHPPPAVVAQSPAPPPNYRRTQTVQNPYIRPHQPSQQTPQRPQKRPNVTKSPNRAVQQSSPIQEASVERQLGCNLRRRGKEG